MVCFEIPFSGSAHVAAGQSVRRPREACGSVFKGVFAWDASLAVQGEGADGLGWVLTWPGKVVLAAEGA